MDFFALDKNGAQRLAQSVRDTDENPPPTDYYTWTSGLDPGNDVYAKITLNNDDGTYEAEEVVWNAGAWDVKTNGLTWGVTSSDVGLLYASNGSADYYTAQVVHTHIWGDIDGSQVWIFDTAVEQVVTTLCYGDWQIYWGVSASMMIPTEGQILIRDDYSEVAIHHIDDNVATQTGWIEQFKSGDVMKLATLAAGLGVYFTVDVQNPVVGDYTSYDTSTCDVSNEGTLTDGTHVSVCIGLRCGGAGSTDIDEGRGIEVVESPADNFTITSLLTSVDGSVTVTIGAAGAAHDLAVDLDWVYANIDWTEVPVCDSIEWSGYSIPCLHLVNDEDEPDDYQFYAKTTTGQKGWHSWHDFVLNTTSIAWTLTLTGEEEADVRLTSDSTITDLAGGLELISDEATPGLAHYYGTDPTAPGNKGWYGFTQLTVYTDLQLDGSNNLQYKTTEIWAAEPGIESAWSNVTGWSTTSCT